MKLILGGQELKYIGKGFLGFNPEHKTMKYATTDINPNDLWVDYFNGVETLRLLVRRSDIESI